MRDLFQGKPVLTVFHEQDGDWQYLTGGEATPENAQLVHRSHVHAVDPELRELHDLPRGHMATRAAPGEHWHVGVDPG